MYTVRLVFTKLSPPVTHGAIPKIGRKKLLERLEKYGLTERDVDKTKQPDGSYAVWLGGGYLLEIRPIRRGFWR